MSEWPYIIAAYAITWALLGGFALYLALRERRARDDFIGGIPSGGAKRRSEEQSRGGEP